MLLLRWLLCLCFMAAIVGTIGYILWQNYKNDLIKSRLLRVPDPNHNPSGQHVDTPPDVQVAAPTDAEASEFDDLFSSPIDSD